MYIIKQTSIVSIIAVLLGYTSYHYNDHVAHANKKGVPSCTVGQPAGGSAHNFTGPINFGSFIVRVGNRTLNSSIVNSVTPDMDLDLVLKSVNNTQFSGLLMVLNQPNVTLTTNLVINPSTSTDYEIETSCAAEYSGFAHTDNNLKSNTTAIINLPVTNQSAYLDVNILVTNDANISKFYHSRFAMLAGGPVTPTAAPTIPRRPPCGLFGLSILCFNGCGFFGRLLGLCNRS